ncbi:MAG: NUDIX hydrolase [Pseudomonadota bacterium]
MSIDKSQVRNASTVVVLRDRYTDAPRILMGQRGANAAFMPSKFVFPGGALDAGDHDIPLARAVPQGCAARLASDCAEDISQGLAAAAIRELYEETGQILGVPAPWPDAPPDWAEFASAGYRPDASGLQFIFRALTPPGRPRRFDARFFLVDADALVTDPDDFTAASDELSHLQWVRLDAVRALDMPFITEVVLAEVQARAQDPSPPDSVPYFKNSDEENLFLRLRGHRVPHPGED